MNVKDIIDFYDVPSSAEFDLPPAEAISFFRAKGLSPNYAWQDLASEEYDVAFSIAKMLDLDLLQDVYNSLLEALENGTVYEEWASNIIPTLQEKGWWGRQIVIDPFTGEPTKALLGSAGRLKTIYRTNMASAYAAGAWETIERQAEEAPYLLYNAIDDYRTRPEHAAWDGLVYPVDSKFWDTHYPPNGWNCRCSVIQVSEDDLADLGVQVSKPRRDKTYRWENPRTGEVRRVPEGIDPSFDSSPKSKRVQQLRALAAEKAAAMPDPFKANALSSLAY